ncbi:MAG TPA: VCBS repeat-containing protein, partial [Longimicrobiales bacterium]|nr:VCBS repeat-containing protein [Longimicrobiales bacterium]
EEEGYRWAEVSPGRLGGTGFELRGPSRTGVTFENRLGEEAIAADRNTMNGSGVAAGDVDGDGRADLYFAGLEGPDRLYRNLGGLHFEDVTASAGIVSEGRYSTGVVLADVDGDRDLDLLVASLHQGVSLQANDGAGVFTPVADAGFGSTAHKGTTTLALADIDQDGDLDLYVTNYRERNVNDLMEAGELTWEKTVEGEYRPGSREYALRPPFDEYYTIVEREGLVPERREVGEPDQLFLNDGRGRFREVEEPGTRFLDAEGSPEGPGRGWGLSARFQDVNADGLPDLWVCNDFWTPDRLWLNQGGGVFREAAPFAIRSLSFSSMAVDFSDIDRDGSVDILVTEMLARDHESRLRQYVPEGPWPDIRLLSDARPQYNRNSLYVGRGDGTWAETSWYSGLEASGWSWGTRFLDVDLDGYEDV